MEIMLSVNQLGLFLAATLMLNVTPGPDMLYVLARSVAQGFGAGLVSVCGIAAGCCVHILAVAFGLAGLLKAAPGAYAVIKYAGAAYLIYLGLRVISNSAPLETGVPVKPETLAAIFFQGLFTNVLNPKVALFFLAFLPQFTDAVAGNLTQQVLFLGVLFNLSGTAVNAAVAGVASYTGHRARAYLKNSRSFSYLSGALFIVLGLRLAILT